MPRPELKVDAPELRATPAECREGIDWVALFGRDAPVEVEIGIGKGRFLLEAAAARPDVSHFGIEWANKFLRMVESRALRRGLKNMRFIRDDAQELLPAMPDGSVRAFYVFYPDPWPKKRHQKRRFLRDANADQLARILQPGGWLHVATDHDGYWLQIEPLFDEHPAFQRLGEFGGPDFPVPPDRPLTNFEAKYEVEGRRRHRGSWRRI